MIVSYFTCSQLLRINSDRNKTNEKSIFV